MRDSRTRAGRPTGPGFFVRRLCGAAALSLIAAGAACGGAPVAIPLEPSFPTRDAVVETFLKALAARDVPALQSLAVGETEFRKYIWPSLPASAEQVGMPDDYVWRDTAMRNAGFLAQLLSDHGGFEYRLVAVSFAGDTTDYGPFRVHRKTSLDVRGPAGAETLRLFGSMVESGGRWKIYSFVVD